MPLHCHASWSAFADQRARCGGRLIALSSHAHQAYTSWKFAADDWLLFGRETDGLPADVLGSADAALTIPMACAAQPDQAGVRSLNLSVSVGVVLFEALRQQNSPTLA